MLDLKILGAIKAAIEDYENDRKRTGAAPDKLADGVLLLMRDIYLGHGLDAAINWGRYCIGDMGTPEMAAAARRVLPVLEAAQAEKGA